MVNPVCPLRFLANLEFEYHLGVPFHLNGKVLRNRQSFWRNSILKISLFYVIRLHRIDA